MASWSEWFREAGRIGFGLEDFLQVNLPRDLERLYSSGLPVLDRTALDGKQYNPQTVLTFCKRHPLNWIRIIHRKKKGERYSKFGINADEVMKFIEELKIDLSQFEIQLFESPPNKFGGNILSTKTRTVIEIAEGSQDIVGKSLGDCYHGFIDWSGRLRFLNNLAPREVRKAAKRTLDYLKLSRGNYLPGYYEFIVSDKDQPYFLDYKPQFQDIPKKLPRED